MALTPKLELGLMTALNAPDFTLTRCANGFQDRNARHYPEAPAYHDPVSRRTCNTLCDMGLATYNDPDVPSCITLTDAGIRMGYAMLHAAAA